MLGGKCMLCRCMRGGIGEGVSGGRGNKTNKRGKETKSEESGVGIRRRFVRWTEDVGRVTM
jgi:hypothetical protein